jgi:carbohydrate diacid regulator
MISNQILQSSIENLKSITKYDFAILEKTGRTVAATSSELLILNVSNILDFISSSAESQLIQGNQYFKVFDNGIPEYVILLKGEDEDAYRMGKILAFHVYTLFVAYKEKHDKDNFIKNLLLDNLLLIDIYSRARKLSIEIVLKRVVLLIETASSKSETSLLMILRSILKADEETFVIGISDNTAILVKELKEADENQEIETFSNNVYKKLEDSFFDDIRVATGSVVTELSHISLSYKEAKMAMDICKIFSECDSKHVIYYNKLGISRLIYQIPESICKIFIKEIINKTTMDELLSKDNVAVTINSFFENNLSISEAARSLNIHRNTLVYRLDKIQNMTGLDIKVFENAVIFKIAIMVNRYIKLASSLKAF